MRGLPFILLGVALGVWGVIAQRWLTAGLGLLSAILLMTSKSAIGGVPMLRKQSGLMRARDATVVLVAEHPGPLSGACWHSRDVRAVGRGTHTSIADR